MVPRCSKTKTADLLKEHIKELRASFGGPHHFEAKMMRVSASSFRLIAEAAPAFGIGVVVCDSWVIHTFKSFLKTKPIISTIIGVKKFLVENPCEKII